jgi:hypothetical protein
MPEISIHFQDGFEDDAAEVLAGKSRILNLEHLKTSKLIGLADTKSIDLPEGVVELEINLPGRNLHKRVSLDTRKMRHVGVSVEPGGLVVTPSEREFGYA